MLGHMIILHLLFEELPDFFWSWLHHFTFPAAMYEDPIFSTLLPILAVVSWSLLRGCVCLLRHIFSTHLGLQLCTRLHFLLVQSLMLRGDSLGSLQIFLEHAPQPWAHASGLSDSKEYSEFFKTPCGHLRFAHFSF